MTGEVLHAPRNTNPLELYNDDDPIEFDFDHPSRPGVIQEVSKDKEEEEVTTEDAIKTVIVKAIEDKLEEQKKEEVEKVIDKEEEED